MNAEQLLALYEKVAEAPDAITRLRRFVLDLAVRGKLVPPEPGDEPASELLKRIAAEKAQLVTAGEIRKSREKADLSGENPHELPDKWIWVPFGELHYLVRGVTYSKADVSETTSAGFVPILRATNIGSTLTHDDPVYVKSDRVSPDQYLRRGDYLIALSSGSKNLVGKAALVPDDFNEAFGGFCGVVRLFDPSLVGFVGVFLSSDLYRDSISAGSRGIGINNLKKEVLANLHFPLPPLAEQRRIVAKVEELMALLDRLEAACTVRETTRDQLTAASLARLTAPDADPAEFPANARFALATLPALTTRADQIKPLRQTILNLAVRGKLVDQDPTDEPASELFKRINALKVKNVEPSEMKRAARFAAQRDVPPFELPQTWLGVCLREIAYNLGDGLHGTPDYSSDGECFFINGNNLRDGSIEIYENTKRVSAQERAKHEKRLSENTVLVSINGTLGNVAFYRGEPVILGKSACYFELSPLVLKEYVKLLIHSPYFMEYAFYSATGTTIKNLSLKAMNTFPVPLPPLAEQHRIVAKVDALMALCDRLEAALTTADTTRTRLLAALLHEALAPAARAMAAAE